MTLTPYDTGERLSPIPWVQEDNLRHALKPNEDYGKVDFDNNESTTVITAHVESRPSVKQINAFMSQLSPTGAFTLHAYVHGDEDVKVEMVKDDKDVLLIQPSEALQTKVQETIAELRTEYERDAAEVYWQDWQALILVPGEKHVRKQMVIMVHEPGYPYADTDSAYVKDWANGIRETRIG